MHIHFAARDAVQTRFAAEPAPLIELGLAVASIQRPDAGPRSRRGEPGGGLPAAARPLLQLIPPSGAGPLFLDPPAADLAAGLDAVRRTPAATVRSELGRVFDGRRVTPWVRSLASMDRRAWTELDSALRAAYASLVAPGWDQARRSVRADVAARGRAMSARGLQALADVHPGMRWTGSALVLPGSARAVDLGGRGLQLLPSAFWTGPPLIGCWVGRWTLVYRSAVPLSVASPGGVRAGALGALLGHTRAAVLAGARDGVSTSDLARRAGISVASASEHAGTLRRAGLIVTERTGKSVRHTTTALGDQMLDVAR